MRNLTKSVSVGAHKLSLGTLSTCSRWEQPRPRICDHDFGSASVQGSLHRDGGGDRRVLGHRQRDGGLGCTHQPVSERHYLLFHRLTGLGWHCGRGSCHPARHNHQHRASDSLLQLPVVRLHSARPDPKFHPCASVHRHRSLFKSQNTHEVGLKVNFTIVFNILFHMYGAFVSAWSHEGWERSLQDWFNSCSVL